MNSMVKFALFVALLVAPMSRAFAAPFDLSYGGRLTDATGKPVEGPITISVSFYRSATGSDLIPVTVAPIANVTLESGIFKIDIPLSATDQHQIFTDSQATWIEIKDVTHDKIFPRSKFNVVPFALKIPVDNKTISYDNSGSLRISTTTPGSGQYLKGNADGTVSWVTLSPGTGDMDKATYDVGPNGVVDDAEKLNGQAAAFYAIAANLTSHTGNTANPHSVTKAQVGLGNVENTALSTWAGSSNITNLGTVTAGNVDALVGPSSVELGNVQNINVQNSWTQNDAQYIATDEIRARDSDGLKLQNNAGNAGITVSDAGKVGIGSTNPGAQLELGSFNAGNGAIKIKNTGTFSTTATGNAYFISNDGIIDLTGASSTHVIGIHNIPYIDSSNNDPNIAQFSSLYNRLYTNAGYTGTISFGRSVVADNPILNGPNKIGNYVSFSAAGITNASTANSGNTSGTISNFGFQAEASTAEAGVGGTLNNAGVVINVPNGSGAAGTTNNYGLYITGTSTAGDSNYSLFNESTTKSYFAGYVGIGTTSPTYPLDIVGNVGRVSGASYGCFSMLATGTNGREYRVCSTDDANGVGGGKLNFYDQTGSNSRLTITSTGFVGIGTTNPGRKLDVIGEIRSFNADSTESAIFAQNSLGGLYIAAGTTGYAGICRTNSAGAYVNCPLMTASSNTAVPDMQFAGCVGYNGGTIGSCTSDERLKKNITPITGAWERISRLRPVHYEWKLGVHPSKTYPEGIQAGFIAQEVEQIYPELVTTDVEGFKRVTYGLELQMQTIVALQELSKEKDEKIQQLSNQVEALKLLVCQDHPEADICN